MGLRVQGACTVRGIEPHTSPWSGLPDALGFGLGFFA